MRLRRVFLFFLSLLILLAAFLFYDSYTRIATTDYVLHYSALPDSFDGFRIAVLSDIHAAVFGEDNEGLISKVREAGPDIIAVTGDLIDKHEKPPTDAQLRSGTIVSP